MRIEFDPEKDRANIAKHKISLARAADLGPVSLELAGFVTDNRYYERRYRIYAPIDGRVYCLAATFDGDALRAISLRRAQMKEYRRWAPWAARKFADTPREL